MSRLANLHDVDTVWQVSSCRFRLNGIENASACCIVNNNGSRLGRRNCQAIAGNRYFSIAGLNVINRRGYRRVKFFYIGESYRQQLLVIDKIHNINYCYSIRHYDFLHIFVVGKSPLENPFRTFCNGCYAIMGHKTKRIE